MKKKINIVTLGCSKNIVDSEHLAAQLHKEGFEIVYDSNSTDAKVVVINTCGFIGDAKEESIDTILGFAKARQQGLIDHLFVMGCLSERYRDELRSELPEVDQFFGVNDLSEIIAVAGGRYRRELDTERILTTPPHYAYLKISEGCNWGCGYCAIPLIRGKHRSVPFDELLEEAAKLAAKGVKELMVIAQDTTYYGLDLYKKRRLGELLRALCRIEGIEWIRLHYAYPAAFPDDVIDAMAEEPKICKYLDIPFQHISDSQLRTMRRGITKDETIALIDKLRERVPGIAIRTTMLTGYCGESEEDFRELTDFVKKTRFERLGVFPYCEEEGTFSATDLSDDVPEQTKQERADKIMALQNSISLEANMRRVGSVQRAIIDRSEKTFYIGRTEYDSPEVDTEIMIKSNRELHPGDFCMVKITACEEYDLYGETYFEI